MVELLFISLSLSYKSFPTNKRVKSIKKVKEIDKQKVEVWYGKKLKARNHTIFPLTDQGQQQRLWEGRKEK